MMSVQVRSDNLNQGPGWAFGYGAAVLEDPSRSGTPQSPGTYQWDGAYGHKWFIDPVEHLTRSEEHTSELQSLMRISYAVFCLKKKKNNKTTHLQKSNTDTH